MKYLIPFLFFIFVVPAYSKPCIPARDEIRFSDADMRFSSVVITDSKKILLVSKEKNENMEFDCSALEEAGKSNDPNKPWARQETKPSKWAPFLFPLFGQSREVKITNKNEFPVTTEVTIGGARKQIRVLDKISGKFITLFCQAPQAVRVIVGDNNSRKEIYSRGDKSLGKNLLLPTEPDVPGTAANPDVCENQTLNVDFATQKIKKNSPIYSDRIIDTDFQKKQNEGGTR